MASEYHYTLEQFLELTMRQLMGFLKRIHLRNTKKEYYRMRFTANLYNREITPLEEILGVSSNEGPAFDPEVDKALEARAKQFISEHKERV